MAPCTVPLSVARDQVRSVRVFPLAQHPGEPGVLALLRAEALDDGVAAHRIGERAAETRVPAVGKTCHRRDIAERQQNRDRDEEHGAKPDDRSHDRPIPAHQRRRAYQHDDRGKQRDEQRVVKEVQRPHAARDLAYGRAGKAVGMPVAGEPLDVMKGACGDVGHHDQREPHDDHEGDMPQDDGAERQDQQNQKRRNR
ncbi:hypothetical protein ABIA22_005043 [Sinorhizobium fredii]